MRTYIWLASLAAVLMGTPAMAADWKLVEGQRNEALDKEVVRKVKLNFVLHLPRGIAEPGKKWPLILFLHGSGESGSDIEKVKLHGPLTYAAAQPDFPFIVLAPQAPEPIGWNTADVLALLDEAIAKLPVDTGRIYLTGLSMGGYAAWQLAVEHPERFAAVAPVCGAGRPFTAWRLKQLPIWAFHGALDPVVPLQDDRNMVDAVKIQGGNARLTVYPDAGHDSWTRTYANPELYRWFLEHSLH